MIPGAAGPETSLETDLGGTDAILQRLNTGNHQTIKLPPKRTCSTKVSEALKEDMKNQKVITSSNRP